MSSAPEPALPLAEPVPCRGALGLWRVPDDVESAVRAQLEARMSDSAAPDPAPAPRDNPRCSHGDSVAVDLSTGERVGLICPKCAPQFAAGHRISLAERDDLPLSAQEGTTDGD